MHTTSLTVRAVGVAEAQRVEAAALKRGFGWTKERKSEVFTEYHFSAWASERTMYEFYCELVGVEA